MINKECGVVVISGEHIVLMGDMETCRAGASYCYCKVVTMVVERKHVTAWPSCKSAHLRSGTMMQIRAISTRVIEVLIVEASLEVDTISWCHYRC